MKKMFHGMNWGKGIAVSFMMFAAGTFFMVYVSMTANVDLVTDNYYEQEIQYQQHIQLVNNTKTLEKDIELTQHNGMVNIQFPAIAANDQITGSIHFFRPSDRQSDFTMMIRIDSSYRQSIPFSAVANGFWRAKIFWNAGVERYYSEFPVIIQ